MNREIVIPVRLDQRTFERFSLYDTFVLRRRWTRPAAFALIFTVFAAAALLTGRPQSGLIAGVLLAVGLGLPLVYFGTYFAQVRQQARARKLGRGRAVYTVRLDFDGVRVANDQKRESPVQVKWPEVRAAIRDRHCVYLYVSETRAFLLPDGQASVPDEALWAYLVEHLGDRCRRVRHQ